jgi:alpha,alpha-trehalose-phosphate synthase [UDP-forming]
MPLARRLVIVSNRLPVVLVEGAHGVELHPSSGGLSTALRPILRESNGVWIGWMGTEFKAEFERLLAKSTYGNGRLFPIVLTEEEYNLFYRGFCNETVWPLFHDLQSRCNFDPAYWKAYVSVNQKFADVTVSLAARDAFIWVHDYQLMLLGSMLRQLNVVSKLAFFQHIPFPPADIFEKLPWRTEILRAFFDFDLVGFQTMHDLLNFADSVRRISPRTKLRCSSGYLITENGQRVVRIGAFPIGIDFEEFSYQASLPEVSNRALEIRREIQDCRILLGVDRLDYTKGIPERLRAFNRLLTCHPELHQKIVLVQVVVPSREDIPKYQELKLDIERLVSQINGEFGRPAWVPIHYVHRHLGRRELLAHYRASDIALITPLKDGMNLVAKEFCAAQVRNEGVLILSEFAGAARQLRNGALLVNPYDIEKVADAIHQAIYMIPKERKREMRKLRRRVCQEDVFRWCERFCASVEDLHLPRTRFNSLHLLRSRAQAVAHLSDGRHFSLNSIQVPTDPS